MSTGLCLLKLSVPVHSTPVNTVESLIMDPAQTHTHIHTHTHTGLFPTSLALFSMRAASARTGGRATANSTTSAMR